MNNEIALDTNIVFQIFKNDLAVAERLQAIDTIYLPIPVIAEVYIGFHAHGKSKSSQAAMKEFEAFAADAKLIGCTREVAVKYAEINVVLREAGAMIPQNDIWIASCCVVANQKIATRDSHFLHVPGLEVEMW